MTSRAFLKNMHESKAPSQCSPLFTDLVLKLGMQWEVYLICLTAQKYQVFCEPCLICRLTNRLSNIQFQQMCMQIRHRIMYQFLWKLKYLSFFTWLMNQNLSWTVSILQLTRNSCRFLWIKKHGTIKSNGRSGSKSGVSAR